MPAPCTVFFHNSGRQPTAVRQEVPSFIVRQGGDGRGSFPASILQIYILKNKIIF